MLESLDCGPVTESKKRLLCGESTLSSVRRDKQGVVKEPLLCHRHVPTTQKGPSRLPKEFNIGCSKHAHYLHAAAAGPAKRASSAVECVSTTDACTNHHLASA